MPVTKTIFGDDEISTTITIKEACVVIYQENYKHQISNQVEIPIDEFKRATAKLGLNQ